MHMKRMVALILLLAVIFGATTGVCDEYRVYVLCNPKTPVNVRSRPKKGTTIVGRLDFGDWVLTEGEERNGFLRVYGIGEAGDGWLFAGYAVKDEPEKLERAWAYVAASGRVKSYRWIGGKQKKWMNVCDEVKVYAISDEWAYTSKGYIRTKYLEVWYE